jgi:hypothetical protein
VAEDGVGIRDASRFSHVLHLGEPQLHLNAPVPPSPDTERRLDAAASGASAQILVRISTKEFLELTAVDRSVPQDAGTTALTAADSRSRE